MWVGNQTKKGYNIKHMKEKQTKKQKQKTKNKNKQYITTSDEDNEVRMRRFNQKHFLEQLSPLFFLMKLTVNKFQI